MLNWSIYDTSQIAVAEVTVALIKMEGGEKEFFSKFF